VNPLRSKAEMRGSGTPGPGEGDGAMVATEGKNVGRVLLLQEGPSRVLVLSAGLARVEAVVELAVASGQPGFGREWADDDNARGEGLLLMARGHMLVAKQKDPVCLIEFGPAGDAPLGVSPETLLAPGARLALPRRPRGGTIGYGVLGWWELAGGTRTALRAPTTWRWTLRGGSCS
jgi:hypothetical protein